MEINFKFAVGDTVNHKVYYNSIRLGIVDRQPYRSSVLGLFVVERFCQQCPGGVQLHYRVRSVSSDGGMSDFFQVNEEEVEAFDLSLHLNRPDDLESLSKKVEEYAETVQKSIPSATPPQDAK